jgi:hypothetical protein
MHEPDLRPTEADAHDLQTREPASDRYCAQQRVARSSDVQAQRGLPGFQDLMHRTGDTHGPLRIELVRAHFLTAVAFLSALAQDSSWPLGKPRWPGGLVNLDSTSLGMMVSRSAVILLEINSPISSCRPCQG